MKILNLFILTFASTFGETQAAGLNSSITHHNNQWPKSSISRHLTHDVNADDNKIQHILDKYINEKGVKYYLSGIPFTIQCQHFSNNSPVTFNAGLQSTNGAYLTDSSLWQIGSNSKSFLAVVILQLEAENKLSLNDKVSNYFPENQFPKWQDITIKQLLNMTSGIRDYINDEADIPSKIEQNPYRLFATDEILDSVKLLDLWFNPGTKWKYSNTNYVLAGKIIEKITGNTVSEEINSRIIKRLNLKHTYYINTFPQENISPNDKDNLMSGYFGSPDQPKFPDNTDVSEYSLSWANAAGSIISTSADMTIYIQALFNNNLLTPKQFHKLISVVDEKGNTLPDGVNKKHPLGYGLGIVAIYVPELGSVMYSHDGETLGFRSRWMYLDSTKASIVYAFNSTKRMNKDESQLVDELLDNLPESCVSP